MAPNSEAVILKDFDGYTSYAWISPLLIVCLAAMASSAVTSGSARLASLIIGAVGSLTLTLLSAVAISMQDLSGVSKELETASGIAASHGIEGLEISNAPAVAFSIGVFLGLGLLFLLSIFTCRNWAVKSSKPGSQTSSPVKDSISLWDEQR